MSFLIFFLVLSVPLKVTVTILRMSSIYENVAGYKRRAAAALEPSCGKQIIFPTNEEETVALMLSPNGETSFTSLMYNLINAIKCFSTRARDCISGNLLIRP